MSARAGAKTARLFKVGQSVCADRPGPKAQIRHGYWYEVAAIEFDDSMGYVRLAGVDGRYRPYLFLSPLGGRW